LLKEGTVLIAGRMDEEGADSVSAMANVYLQAERRSPWKWNLILILQVLLCRLWMAFVSLRSVRGLMVFFPFLKLIIAHLATPDSAGGPHQLGV
jgi:hypothetical protein